MKKLAGVAAILSVLALLAIVATALATDSAGVTSMTLAQGNVEEIDVRVKTDAWKVQIDTKGPSTLAVSASTVVPGRDSAGTATPVPT